MKQNIHPKYYTDCQVSCVCGNKFTVGSTKPTIRVEVCAKCHPFFTGQQKFVDTMGRVERFQKSQKTATSYAALKKTQDAKKKEEEKRIKTGPKTLKEMLMMAKGE
jgi:large subunit ribosomal protein L31